MLTDESSPLWNTTAGWSVCVWEDTDVKRRPFVLCKLLIRNNTNNTIWNIFNQLWDILSKTKYEVFLLITISKGEFIVRHTLGQPFFDKA